MPRKPRILSSTGIYHIILRSVNQHIIFEEEYDYQKFLFILNDCKNNYDIDIYAYCLMDNHVHLLLHSEPANLALFFQSFGSKFVRWYNNKYSRSGHLFQDRFHSTVIEGTANYLSALTYIHNNPVKANICRYPSEYRWSSYNAFYGAKNSLINLQFSFDLAGTKDTLLRYFSSCDDSNDTLFLNDHCDSNHFITDEEALLVFKSVTGLSSTSDVSRLAKTKRNEYIRVLKSNKLTIKQIARIMDVSVSTVKRV